MQTHEIRKRFLDHFVKAGHTEVPSASVILDDPNLLFVNAGMVQFVPYFLGQRTPPYGRPPASRSASAHPISTKSASPPGTTRSSRWPGTSRSATTSRSGAIELAWTLLTNPVDQGGYGFDPEKLWATVYLDDDEAVELWLEVAGLPASASSAAAWPTTTGRWASPDRAARRRRSTTTAARITASKAARKPTRTATSRSGISCSCRTSAVRAPRRRTSRSSGRCRARTSTPAWASNASRAFCRASTTSTRRICCAR